MTTMNDQGGPRPALAAAAAGAMAAMSTALSELSAAASAGTDAAAAHLDAAWTALDAADAEATALAAELGDDSPVVAKLAESITLGRTAAGKLAALAGAA
jgi:hypothetical protein